MRGAGRLKGVVLGEGHVDAEPLDPFAETDLIHQQFRPGTERLGQALQLLHNRGHFRADPVGNGYAASLQRPGGNLTGIAALTTDLSAKRLQLLNEAFPNLSHVVALFEPTDPAAVSQMTGYRAAVANQTESGDSDTEESI